MDVMGTRRGNVFVSVSVIVAIIFSVSMAVWGVQSKAAASDSVFQKFPLQKILTVGATEYCQSKGKNLADFNLVGVNGCSTSDLIHNLPNNTEVVVGYTGDMDTYFATALVPKEKK
jgi:hypothetical protein